jgi:hypothetical protein
MLLINKNKMYLFKNKKTEKVLYTHPKFKEDEG